MRANRSFMLDLLEKKKADTFFLMYTVWTRKVFNRIDIDEHGLQIMEAIIGQYEEMDNNYNCAVDISYGLQE